MLAIMLLYVRRGAFGWPLRVQSRLTVSGSVVK
jgi:hypothetical protein